MQITTSKLDQTVVMELKGRMDVIAAMEYEKAIAECRQRGDLKFVVDLNALDYINSAGLCSILAIAKKIRERDGNMTICALQGEALKVFEISGFTALFSIYPTEAAALKQV